MKDDALQQHLSEAEKAVSVLQKELAETSTGFLVLTMELQQLEGKYRNMFDKAIGGIFQSDSNGDYVIVNPALARMQGYKLPEELLSSIKRPNYVDSNRASELISLLKKHNEVFRVESEVYDKNNNVIWISESVRTVRDAASGELQGYEGWVTNITERKQAEKDLLEREQLFKGLLESAPDSIVIVGKNGQIQLVNIMTETLFGYERKELLGEKVEILIPERFRTRHPEHRNMFFQKLETRPMGGDLKLFAVRKDGTEFPVEISLGPLKTGDTDLVVCAIHDITQREKTMELLHQKEQELFASQKIEAVGTLAGGLAHDFNNLLTGIRGYTQLLLEDLGADSKQVEDLEEIVKCADRATALTRQLLAFSRKQTLELTVLNLNNLIEDIVKMFGRLLTENISLKFNGAADLGNVRADRNQIEQVLMNLAVNARDAMPEGGTLTIESSNVRLDQEYIGKKPMVKPGSYVVLTVADSGSGMDKVTKERIFEPFFTTKELGRGTGLGLSTVYGIVTQHGGHIWVYSEPGEGTTFKIYLPRVEQEAEDVVKTSKETSAPRGSETILLVEDEPTVIKLAKRVLVGLGYTVFSATHPDEAEKLFMQHRDEISLLVSDVIMPGKNGLELYECLAAHSPSLKVLFMSGYSKDSFSNKQFTDLKHPYISKPFTPVELAQKVRKVLDA